MKREKCLMKLSMEDIKISTINKVGLTYKIKTLSKIGDELRISRYIEPMRILNHGFLKESK